MDNAKDMAFFTTMGLLTFSRSGATRRDRGGLVGDG